MWVGTSNSTVFWKFTVAAVFASKTRISEMEHYCAFSVRKNENCSEWTISSYKFCLLSTVISPRAQNTSLTDLAAVLIHGVICTGERRIKWFSVRNVSRGQLKRTAIRQVVLYLKRMNRKFQTGAWPSKSENSETLRIGHIHTFSYLPPLPKMYDSAFSTVFS